MVLKDKHTNLVIISKTYLKNYIASSTCVFAKMPGPREHHSMVVPAKTHRCRFVIANAHTHTHTNTINTHTHTQHNHHHAMNATHKHQHTHKHTHKAMTCHGGYSCIHTHTPNTSHTHTHTQTHTHTHTQTPGVLSSHSRPSSEEAQMLHNI